MKNVIVIHEYGAPEHYTGAKKALEQNYGNSLDYCEFSTVRLFLKRLKAGSFSLACKAIKDFLFLSLIFLIPILMKGRVVILGCAPLDWRIIIFKRALKYSKVIYHSSWLYWDGSKYPKSTKHLSQFLKSVWQDFLCNQVKHIASVTPDVKEQLCQYMSVKADSVAVVYHSFDNQIFKPISHDAPQETPNKYKLNVIFVGRLIEDKGIDDLISLANKLPECHFSIVGKGRLEPIVQSAAVKLSNFDYLGFISSREQLAKVYRESDVLLQPSKRTTDWEELFGMAIIEAMACETVPLVTDHVGPKTILQGCDLSINILQENQFIEYAYDVISEYINSKELLLKDKYIAKGISDIYALPQIAQRWDDIFKEI